MMNIVDIHSYCSNGECFLMYTKYPQFGVHKKQHDVRKCQQNENQEFLERLTSFKKDVGKKADSALGKELLDYCISWLTNHIRVVDVRCVGVNGGVETHDIVLYSS